MPDLSGTPNGSRSWTGNQPMTVYDGNKVAFRGQNIKIREAGRDVVYYAVFKIDPAPGASTMVWKSNPDAGVGEIAYQPALGELHATWFVTQNEGAISRDAAIPGFAPIRDGRIEVIVAALHALFNGLRPIFGA